MGYHSLGRTGVQVSPLCLGCMNFGGRAGEEESLRIIRCAIERGINFIDTANVYGHEPLNYSVGRGRSEEIVGKALQQSGRREEIILATKAYFPMSSSPNGQGSSRRHLIQQCEGSLRRLQTDYIDLYQVHHPSNEIPVDETLRALDDLVHSGKVRYIGSSTFAAWQIVEALWVSKEYGLNRFISEQPSYNLLDRRIERELVPMAQTYGIAILPWSPLAGGFLTGIYQRDTPPPAGSRFDAFWKSSAADHFIPAAFAILDLVKVLASEKACSPAQLALAWCLQQPGVTSPIIGPRSQAQLEDCLGALTLKLTPDDLARIDAVAPPGRVAVPYYGADGLAWAPWGPHKHHW